LDAEEAELSRNGHIEVQRLPTLSEAFEQKKFAKIGIKKFEDMTSEVLGELSSR
jgi:hypothetical protein